MLALGVDGDGNVDVLQGSIGVTEGNDGTVGVTGFLDGLMVSEGVRDDKNTGLEVGGLLLVSKSTRDPVASDGLSSSELLELEDGTLSEGAGGNDSDVCERGNESYWILRQVDV